MTSALSSTRRIVLVTSLLGGGGAERVLLTMAAWWQRQGHVVIVLVLREKGAVQDYAVPPGIEVRYAGLIREKNPLGRPSQLWHLARLRKAIVCAKPDVVVSFIDKLNVAVLISLMGRRIPVVATEHFAPWRQPLGRSWEWLRRLAYRRARMVVSPTEPITAWFRAQMSGRFTTLAYPASYSAESNPRRERRSVVVGVGRLVPQKGFDLLIDAFGRVAEAHPEWTLEIAGEGPERARLAEKIEKAQWGLRVKLLGQVRELWPLLETAGIFALASRHEAFPMALAEAMAAGCSVVAADCPTGPREMLGGGDYGRLVPAEDVGAFARELAAMMADPALRARLGQAAKERATAFAPGAVMPQWDELIAACTREPW